MQLNEDVTRHMYVLGGLIWLTCPVSIIIIIIIIILIIIILIIIIIILYTLNIHTKKRLYDSVTRFRSAVKGWRSWLLLWAFAASK